MNIFNSKTLLLLSFAFFCGGIQAMQQQPKRYITKVAITGSLIEDIPQRVHILPFTSTSDEVPKKLEVEEAPGVTLNGINDVAVHFGWQPHTELRFKLKEPVLINVDDKNPELEIIYGCNVLDEPIHQYFMADEINALGVHNVLYIDLDNPINGMRLEPVIRGG